jgi:hypothetical protein
MKNRKVQPWKFPLLLPRIFIRNSLKKLPTTYYYPFSLFGIIFRDHTINIPSKFVSNCPSCFKAERLKCKSMKTTMIDDA